MRKNSTDPIAQEEVINPRLRLSYQRDDATRIRARSHALLSEGNRASSRWYGGRGSSSCCKASRRATALATSESGYSSFSKRASRRHAWDKCLLVDRQLNSSTDQETAARAKPPRPCSGPSTDEGTHDEGMAGARDDDNAAFAIARRRAERARRRWREGGTARLV